MQLISLKIVIEGITGGAYRTNNTKFSSDSMSTNRSISKHYLPSASLRGTGVLCLREFIPGAQDMPAANHGAVPASGSF